METKVLISLAILSAYGQYSFPKRVCSKRHLAIGVIVPQFFSTFPFSFGVYGADNSSLTVFCQHNCFMSFGTFSPAPSQTKVRGCTISAKNCSMALSINLKK